MSTVRSIYSPDHKEPVTLLERLAYALCAHDHMGGEGHLTDDELESLEKLLANYPESGKGQEWSYPIRNLAEFEGYRRQTEGKEVALMHFVWRDWPNYMESAKAALTVIAELPETIREEMGRTSNAGDGS